MTVLTLLVKARSSTQLKQVDDLLGSEFEDLDLSFKVLGVTINGWVQVSVSGEDETIAANYITKEIGTCPVGIKSVEKFSVLKGYISKVDVSNDELIVDIGVFEPKVIQATISLASLQAQLADGRKIGLKRISEMFGLRENLPVSVKLVDLVDEASCLSAELSPIQIEKLGFWRDSLLDRLIVLGAPLAELELLLKRTGLKRDIIEIERLGLFEYALTCKLGTDAAGLVPRLGRYMRNAVFVVFNSKRLLSFMSETPLTL